MEVTKNYTRHGEKRTVSVPLLTGSYMAGRCVLITGGATGIGYAIAEACLRNDADVIIASRNPMKLENARAKLEMLGKGSVGILELDVSSPETFDLKVKEASELLPRKPDALVNCAGTEAGKAFGDTEISKFDTVLETNLRGTYFFCQAFANYMIENNIEGNILMISSASAVRPAISPYMLSKWGILGLTEGLAKKLIPYNIVVNGIGPGPTPTPMIKMDPDGDYTKLNSPSGRFIIPEEVSNMAVFLMSNMGRMIVGDTVFITGGVGTLTKDDMVY